MSWNLSTGSIVENEEGNSDYCYAHPDGLPPAETLRRGERDDEDDEGYSYGRQDTRHWIGGKSTTKNPFQVPEPLVHLFKEISEYKLEDIKKMGVRSWNDKAYLYRGPVDVYHNKNHFIKWKMRYMILLTRYVLVYNNKDSSKPSEWISLRNYHRVERKIALRKHPFVFCLSSHCGENEWTFSTESSVEMKNFIDCMKGSIDFLGKGKLTDRCVKQISALKNLDVGDAIYCHLAAGDEDVISYVFPANMADYRGGYVNEPVSPERNYDKPPPSSVYDGPPTYAQLSILSSKFGCDWKSFAREELGHEKAEIDQCIADHTGKVVEQVLEALEMWKKKNPRCCTLGDLLERLSSARKVIEYSDFAFLDPEGRYDPRNPTPLQNQSYSRGASTPRPPSSLTVSPQPNEESVLTRSASWMGGSVPHTEDSKQDMRPMPIPNSCTLPPHSSKRSPKEPPHMPPLTSPTLRQYSSENSEDLRPQSASWMGGTVPHTEDSQQDTRPPMPIPNSCTLPPHSSKRSPKEPPLSAAWLGGTVPHTEDSEQDMRPPMPTPDSCTLPPHSSKGSPKEPPVGYRPMPPPKPCICKQAATESIPKEPPSMPKPNPQHSAERRHTKPPVAIPRKSMSSHRNQTQQHPS